MKKSVYNLIILFSLILHGTLGYAQQSVTLTVSGSGTTQQEARDNALRSAIEQAYGVFISSNTEIINDEIIRDEIISISSGNIEDFTILYENKIDESTFASSISATVSLSRLTEYSSSKGFETEFAGSSFAFNIKQQQFNLDNETLAIRNLAKITDQYLRKAFDYSMATKDPIVIDQGRDQSENWSIPIEVSVSLNENFNNAANILTSTLIGLSLSMEEAMEYRKLGKTVYPITIKDTDGEFHYIQLRSEESRDLVYRIIQDVGLYVFNFRIENGVDVITPYEIVEKVFPDPNLRGYVPKTHPNESNFRLIRNTAFYYNLEPTMQENVNRWVRNSTMITNIREYYNDNYSLKYVIKSDKINDILYSSEYIIYGGSLYTLSSYYKKRNIDIGLNYGDTLIISKEFYHSIGVTVNNFNEKRISITDFNYKDKLTDDQYRKVQGNGFCNGRFYEIGSSIDLDDVVELVSAPFSENYPLEQGHKDCADTVFDDPPYSKDDRLDTSSHTAISKAFKKDLIFQESEFPDSFLIPLTQDPSIFTTDNYYKNRHNFSLGYFFDFNINLNSEILLLEFDDQRNIEELSKITGYSLKANGSN